ncbi:hypothetical protein [Eremococcus coleocola]|nr:hypothetical protein [Eremococcus coleocola]
MENNLSKAIELMLDELAKENVNLKLQIKVLKLELADVKAKNESEED